MAKSHNNNDRNIVIDGNILGLQVYGGVSGYAARTFVELTKMAVNPKIILPPKIRYQGFGKEQILNATKQQTERLPAKISQYLPVDIRGDEVFHTAYYRRPFRKAQRYVVTVHDFTYERFRTGLARHVHHYVKMSAINAADAIICISEATKLDVMELCPHIDPARLSVIPHGVDHSVFFPDPQPELAAKMEKTILFVGQRSHYKRFDLALKAVAQFSDLNLAIVGHELSPEETATAQKWLPDRWSSLGRVSDDQLRQLYSSAHGFIFPSDYEGFGLPVLEAMACGCPVVTSADRALREVAGAAGLYAPEQTPESYANALAALQDVKFRQNLRERGLALAKTASWDDCMKRTLNILMPS